VPDFGYKFKTGVEPVREIFSAGRTWRDSDPPHPFLKHGQLLFDPAIPLSSGNKLFNRCGEGSGTKY
jgi:hypothetical protein